MQGAICPVPLQHSAQVVLGHGSGGKMTQDLIERSFYPPFKNPTLLRGNDSAVVTAPEGGRLAITTDNHIVAPLFFPGGDIGRLAICGAVNDLAMVGARPLWLTAAFILEEGLPLEVLERVVESMRRAAEEAGVIIVAGDTKVAERGKADGLFINTSGVGWVPEGREVGGAQARPGDGVLLSGSIGDHGIAVLAARGELEFEAQVESDLAPLNGLVEAMFEVCPEIHVLRDPTRGGLATTLNEIAKQSGAGIKLEEQKIPVNAAVGAACEMLGFDPLYVANEGKLVAMIPGEAIDAVLEVMRKHPYGKQAYCIGEVVREPAGRVLMRTAIGGTRIVETLSGEMLPRIC
ncbi:MAG TPA: hydrogenase expression/formation protein HypE [Anaerolineae bacterium]|nr:hydrogenase expression/formation protein HypE [Anaerolineae bacterium]